MYICNRQIKIRINYTEHTLTFSCTTLNFTLGSSGKGKSTALVSSGSDWTVQDRDPNSHSQTGAPRVYSTATVKVCNCLYTSTGDIALSNNFPSPHSDICSLRRKTHTTNLHLNRWKTIWNIMVKHMQTHLEWNKATTRCLQVNQCYKSSIFIEL